MMALKRCDAHVNEKGRELKSHGTVSFPAACYYDALGREGVPWHWHEEWEAAVVAQGVAVVSADGQAYTLSAGEGIFINASVLHRLSAKGDGDCLVRSIVFHPRLVGGGMDSVFYQRYVQPVLSNNRLRSIPFSPDTAEGAYICEAWTQCAQEQPGYELRVRAALSMLAFALVSRCPGQKQQPTGKALRAEERSKAMLTYIQAHLHEALTVAHIAQSAAVSTSECLRCFREVLGTTPMQYVRQLRLQRAAELLESTGLKIAEIGFSCGFQEMSYFSKSFRDAMGCTPKEYRLQKKLPKA